VDPGSGHVPPVAPMVTQPSSGPVPGRLRRRDLLRAGAFLCEVG
jgi:hypothetical protein